MTLKSRNLVLLAVTLAIVATLVLLNNQYHFTGGHGKVVDALIARNIEARGGAAQWRAVSSLRFEGEMDLGQNVRAPYTLEQKRPGKMCLAFEFDGAMATQCVDGESGWKQLPFMGRDYPEAMNETELREMAGAVSVDGLLFDSDKRGYRVRLLGKEMLDNRQASKLEVTLPSGALRWVYLDDETGLEIKFQAMRSLRGQQRLMETVFSQWQSIDGLLFPRLQETRMVGDADSHLLTVETVSINPPIDDARFAMPLAQAASAVGNAT